MTEKYVIALTEDGGEQKFLYHDPDFGYLFGSTYLSEATFFDHDAAVKELKNILNQKASQMTDGTINPPDYIIRGLSLSYAKPEAFGTLCIMRVELVALCNHMHRVSGKIKRPTGFTYD